MRLPLLLLLLTGVGTARAADEAGFVRMFNGRDLTGWVNANCAPETWSVKDGVIHCTGHPTGALRTVRQYENFILELEWRHLSSGGNSGVFIWGTPIPAPGVPFLRGIEVQVLDEGYNVGGKNEWYTTHGDVFPIHGATMKPFGRHNGMRSFPSKERSRKTPEWNHYRIVGTNGVLRLSVNGEEVSGGEDCNYRKGYLALESEGAPVEFRNIRILELPPGGASPQLTAPEDKGWRALFTGLDLRGWQTNDATAARWKVEHERLQLLPGTTASSQTLWTDEEFGDAEFVLDCRPAKASGDLKPATPMVCLRGQEGDESVVQLAGGEPGAHTRYVITLRGRTLTVRDGEREVARRELPPGAPARGRFGIRATESPLELMNLFVRPL